MFASERVELMFLQKYKGRGYKHALRGVKVSTSGAKEINVPSICQTCFGRCKASVELIACPGKSKWG